MHRKEHERRGDAAILSSMLDGTITAEQQQQHSIHGGVPGINPFLGNPLVQNMPPMFAQMQDSRQQGQPEPQEHGQLQSSNQHAPMPSMADFTADLNGGTHQVRGV